MEITCPACNKGGQTEAACSRCGCDLTRLRAVVNAASATVSAARAALGRAAWSEALDQAQTSWQLLHTANAARVAFLAAAVLGDIAVALRWRQRAAQDWPDVT
jgi:uncharacterized protein (DUF983 family)